ncbi:hypothetical protein [Vibrio cholerae]|uniref:hypothetical protein n=1 Tax=Vibrio cholerae TaxID=666 RepID=UPI000E65E172|nr:hypothetical protein [Vibrio cholerae]
MVGLDVLEVVKAGQRSFTVKEREQAMADHNFLYEYVRTQNKSERNSLSDKDLADELFDAHCDYAK